ncbi:type I methionyl aminopeptidase [Catellatospora coxensis]
MDIEIKTPEQLHLMRAAGLVVAAALAAARDAVKPGVSTAELDAVAEDVIRSHGAIPSFKGYHGFPGTICSSVNEQIVHTIPNPKHVLAEGDLISIDCGAILDGWHGDAAITVGVGRPVPICCGWPRSPRTRCGPASPPRRAGRSGAGRLTDISWAVESAVRKAPRKYGIVKGYGGHGIGTAMHQEPHIHNHGRPGRGPQLIPGMALAIEPMITMGSARTAELNDGWTVVTTDGSHAAHVEHSIGLFEDGVWVLTAPDGGRARLGDLLTSAATA